MVKIMTHSFIKRNVKYVIFKKINRRRQTLTSQRCSLSLSILLCIFCLIGCATQQQTLYQLDEVILKQTFKDWDVKECHLINQKEHATLKTDGTESHRTIRFLMVLNHVPQEPPLITLIGLGGENLNMGGRNKTWSFEVSNTPYSTAQMLAGDAYLIVEYKPMPTYRKPSPEPLISTFSLEAYPKALLHLYKACGE